MLPFSLAKSFRLVISSSDKLHFSLIILKQLVGTPRLSQITAEIKEEETPNSCAIS